MIRVEQLVKSYGSKVVIGPLSLHVPQGQFLALVGPSGCGKTTLLNCLAGFIRPQQGACRVNGRDAVPAGPNKAVVFQEATLFPWMTVLENVMFGLEQKGGDRNQSLALATSMLQLVGMHPEHYTHHPLHLSGGMKQRVALARTLVLAPDVLLLDEPFSALDTMSREHLQDQLIELQAKTGLTTVFVTHSVEEAVYIADRIIVMGRAPESLIADHTLSCTRSQRSRTSNLFRNEVALVRRYFSDVPCCLEPAKRFYNDEEPAY